MCGRHDWFGGFVKDPLSILATVLVLSATLLLLAAGGLQAVVLALPAVALGFFVLYAASDPDVAAHDAKDDAPDDKFVE